MRPIPGGKTLQFAFAALIAIVALGPGSAGTARAVELSAIEAYLDGITTLEARFSQVAPDGTLSTGVLALHRPGRLRLDYDPPSGVLLVAPGDWRLVFYDASIRQVNVIPVSETPLGFLLEDELDLESDDIEILAIEEQGDEIGMTVARADALDQGRLTLIFGASPLTLRRWNVLDAQGLVTHIILEDVRLGSDIDPDLFRWRDPKIFGFPEG